MESKKRERSANYNAAEIELLVNLVCQYKQIIENKKTDAVTNKDKEAAWKKIENTFNSCGFATSFRSWKTLKLKYEGLKKNTKKKSSLQRQEMYRTGGGPSNAPTFNGVEEKVLSICSNIKGLEGRHDSDTIPNDAEIVLDPEVLISLSTEDKKPSEGITQYIQNDNLDESIIMEVNEDLYESEKENKWDKMNPKALKTRVTQVLKPDITKASVTSKLDKLSSARLELVKLQIESAKEAQQFLMMMR